MDNSEWVEFLTNFIVESDAIENIVDDSEVVRRELLERKGDGHVGALLYLGSLVQSPINHILDHADIQLVQRLIVSEKKPGVKWLPSSHRGAYRDCGMIIGGKRCMDPGKVYPSMNELLKKTHHWQENARFQGAKENVARMADFHFDFMTIHPFADGNGRTGRALSYFFFLHAAMEPFVFAASDKHSTYYPCFDEETSRLMREYFLVRYVFPTSGCRCSTEKVQ